MNKVFFTFVFASIFLSGIQNSYAMEENDLNKPITKKRKREEVPPLAIENQRQLPLPNFNGFENPQREERRTPPRLQPINRVIQYVPGGHGNARQRLFPQIPAQL